ncbi:MAG: helix-turn-helix domain-containing protein [Prevotella sp.]
MTKINKTKQPAEFFMGGETEKITMPSYEDTDLVVLDNPEIFIQGKSVKAGMNCLVMCTEGYALFKANDHQVELKKMDVAICPPDSKITETVLSPNFHYFALGISSPALQQMLRGNMNIWNRSIYLRGFVSFSLDPDDYELMFKLYRILQSALRQVRQNIDTEWWKFVINHVICVALNGICYRLKHMDTPVETKPKQSNIIFNRFLDILQHNDKKHQTVDYYADKLFISSKYLSDICKKQSGKSAAQWIKESTLSEITFLLKTTDLTVKEISSKMGFPNSSFFCTYVRDNFGQSPLAYRQTLLKNEGKAG